MINPELPEDAPGPVSRFKETNRIAEDLAAAEVALMELPARIDLRGSFDALGTRSATFAKKNLGRLQELHGENLPFVIALAVREMWFAACSAAHYMRISSEQGDKSSPRLWTPEGYAELNGGFAYTLFNELGNLTPAAARSNLLTGTPLTKAPAQESLLLGIGIYWFDRANEVASTANLTEVLDLLYEGYEAFALNSDAQMWDAGFKLGQEDSADSAQTQARSSLAKKAAFARHAENRAMKHQVFEWCDEHLAKQVSMDAAASQVAGSLVPVAWRTVRDWIAEWKKLRSAGTA